MIDRYNADVERQDLRAALVCAVLANIHRDSKSRVFTPADFMPSYSQRDPSQKAAPEKEELDYLLELAQNLGAEVKIHG